jgi:hypothetical protein
MWILDSEFMDPDPGQGGKLITYLPEPDPVLNPDPQHWLGK